MRRFWNRGIRRLFRTQLFWMLTILGNGTVLGGALLFHWFEAGTNPAVTSFLDSLMWAVGLVTTVGSSVAAVTVAGKIVTILMMMGGALFLWSYMALFIGFLVEPELSYIQREVAEIQHEVRDLTSSR